MLNILKTARATSLRLTSPYRKALSDIPPQLYEYWARTARHEFQGIPRDAFFYGRAAEALLAFFDCVRHSNRPCALPSKAADSIWHAWLRWSPASLDAFCERHFGRRIPHVEAGDMAGGLVLPMAMTLVTARGLEGSKLAGPGVPRLFATDRTLHMPDGFAYLVRGRHMVCSQMDRKGRAAGRTQVLPGTAPAFLLAAGLIGQDDYDLWLKDGAKNDGGGTLDATGEACGEVGDAACDIASSGCGSSCGGGCGGGGCGS